MKTSLRIPVVEGSALENGTIRTLVGSMPLEALVPIPPSGNTAEPSRIMIPRNRNNEQDGYQRSLSPKRVNDLKRELRNKAVDIPTAVLLNRRGVTVDEITEKSGDQRWLVLQRVEAQPEPFFVVDGQHRLCALTELAIEDYEKWHDYCFPFVCMVGATEMQEMRQFYVVNSTAKSVKTDLAYTLLKRQAKHDPQILESLIEQAKDWQVTGQEIVEALACEGPWKGRIRFPGDSKGSTTVTNSAFVTSLKPVITLPIAFRSQTVERQVQILNAYWHGIQRCLSRSFENPQDYALQKGPGVFSLHSVFGHVFEFLRATGSTVTDSKSYEEVMKSPLQELYGDTPSGERVEGLAFWRSHDGAAALYSSHAGRRVLAARIDALLPDIPLS